MQSVPDRPSREFAPVFRQAPAVPFTFVRRSCGHQTRRPLRSPRSPRFFLLCPKPERPLRSSRLSSARFFPCRGGCNRSIDRRVARAAAQVAREARLHLIQRRIPAERDRRHDHPGRADAALRAAVLDEGMLQRVTAAQAFDRHHPRPVDLRDRHQARIHRRAVHEHGAGAALPFAAPFLGAGERAVLAQHVEETLHRVGVQATRRAVQGESHITKKEPPRPQKSQRFSWLSSASFAVSAVKHLPS